VASVAIADRGISPDATASRLFEEHSEWLLAFCTRQLRDRSDAEDAVQATFLYAFRALRNGVVPECERAWLTTIAKNVCHTHRRTSGRRPESAMNPDLDRIALAQPDLDEVGFMDDVRAALSALPENQRRALLRREWQGASSSEIADELHLSGPATDALLFRARKSFASAMSASGRPFGALNVALLLDQLRGWAKPLLGGAAVKAAVATTAASVVVGGVLVEQQRSGGDSPPATRPFPVMATVGVEPEVRATSAPSRVATPIVVTRPRAAVLAPTTARPVPTSSAAVVPASENETVTRIARPPDESAEPPAASAPPPPPAAEAPGTPPPPPTPIPVPPVEPPAPPPVELPPILGEDPPPIELPPPLDEIVPRLRETSSLALPRPT
jgi:RNA polymerase sigma-70 factor (ECF subfamily)